MALKHGLVIVSDRGTNQLRVHSLADGLLVRTIGSHGSGKGQFSFVYGGLCVSPGGDSVLVAEWGNDRVQQVRIIIKNEESIFVRFVGQRLLQRPQFVDCNSDYVVAVESCQRICVLSWATGGVLALCGSKGSGPELCWPRAVRLLQGREPAFVVAECSCHRMYVYAPSGAFLATAGKGEQGLYHPYDMMECENGFIAVNRGARNLVKISRAGVKLGVFGEFTRPTSLAALPDGGLVVREDKRFQIFHDLAFRANWIAVCQWVY